MAIENGHQIKCPNCGELATKKKPWQKFCTVKCQYTFANDLRKRGQTNFKECARCGKSLAAKKSHAIYCSKTCKSMDHTFKHRSKTRFTSTARRKEIYERDSGICYMCLKAVSFEDFDLDHILPMSRGGDSDPSNLSVSCKSCNRSKGDKIGVQQLAKLLDLRA